MVLLVRMQSMTSFDHEKATQMLNFLAIKAGGAINKLKAIKLIWLADRLHLRKYGRPITNDAYFAMKYGPVCSGVKDLAECNGFLADEEKVYRNKFLDCDTNAILVSSLLEVDSDVFSKSDIESLETVYAEYGTRQGFDLAEFSHHFPEWLKFESELKAGNTRAPMSYMDFFNDSQDTGAEKIFSEPKEQLDAAKKIFEENYKLANFWLNS